MYYKTKEFWNKIVRGSVDVCVCMCGGKSALMRKMRWMLQKECDIKLRLIQRNDDGKNNVDGGHEMSSSTVKVKSIEIVLLDYLTIASASKFQSVCPLDHLYFNDYRIKISFIRQNNNICHVVHRLFGYA